jgi:MFS transporter, putative metabolite:H+ symporter
VESPSGPGAPPGTARTPLTGYQKKLIFFLSVATFFEGFDFFALAQILPSLRATFHVAEGAAGVLVAVINIGPILAYLLVRQADRWGRRPVLALTILGYTSLTVTSGLAPNIWVFCAAQLIARIFLIGEWAVAMIYAAEEYPADRRGLVIGVIQACSSLGAVVCAGVVPLLLRTSLGWRSVFLVGGIPLLVIAVARRGIRETRRFLDRGAAPPGALLAFGVWRTRWRGRLVLLAGIWAMTYMCTTTAMLFWKEFAVGERHFTDAQVGGSFTLAALISMPLAFGVGKLIDAAGRRRAAVVIFTVASLSVLGAYTLESRLALTVALVGGVFGTTSVLPVLNAFTTELFPTELRSDAFAWANNLLGRLGAVVAPLAVGAAAGSYGWGPAVAATSVFPLVALALILWKLPETSGIELEQTSALP